MSALTSQPPVSTHPADGFMRRLLRVQPTRDEAVVKQATRAMSRSIVISGIRCLFTYLLIPLAGPVFHLSNSIGRPLTILLGLAAVWFSISSMRRFWTANHRYRWHYTGFAFAIIIYMAYGITADFAHLL